MAYYEPYSVQEPASWKVYDRSYYLYDSDHSAYHSNTVTLHVSMCCEKCVQKVRKSLRNVDDVDSVDVDIRRQQVVVKGHVNPHTVLRKVQKQNKTATFWERSDDYANYSSADAYDYYRPTSSNTYYGQNPASEYAIYISGVDHYRRPTSSHTYYDSSPSYDYADNYPRTSTVYSGQDQYEDRYLNSSDYHRHNDYRSYHRSYDAYRHH